MAVASLSPAITELPYCGARDAECQPNASPETGLAHDARCFGAFHEQVRMHLIERHE
jgi:hypothetical protein